MQDFRKLKVWEKGHRLTLSIYTATLSFPKEEMYGLTLQLRRSCASIPTNISEGCGRGSDQEFKHFLQIAMGSASETEYHLLLAHDLGYLTDGTYEQLGKDIIEIKQMLASFIQKLRTDRQKLTAESG